jgi:hypothetical protein
VCGVKVKCKSEDVFFFGKLASLVLSSSEK